MHPVALNPVGGRYAVLVPSETSGGKREARGETCTLMLGIQGMSETRPNSVPIRGSE